MCTGARDKQLRHGLPEEGQPTKELPGVSTSAQHNLKLSKTTDKTPPTLPHIGAPTCLHWGT